MLYMVLFLVVSWTSCRNSIARAYKTLPLYIQFVRDNPGALYELLGNQLFSLKDFGFLKHCEFKIITLAEHSECYLSIKPKYDVLRLVVQKISQQYIKPVHQNATWRMAKQYFRVLPIWKKIGSHLEQLRFCCCKVHAKGLTNRSQFCYNFEWSQRFFDRLAFSVDL
jgi:hypothetical protein